MNLMNIVSADNVTLLREEI